MRLTMQGEYAVRAMLELAGQYGKGLISAKELASCQDIPPVFLTKILSSLAKNGLIVSHRGSRGGIELAKHPSSITLRAVIEAIEGPFKLNICLGEPGSYERRPTCKVHRVWHRAQDVLLKELDVTLNELV
ncbi:MAG: Rrf2 family transcriptional regulator [Actinomycetota bacterium]|nr:Rrf2 family transcriptional regulator [Actinomycetota bacterium]